MALKELLRSIVRGELARFLFPPEDKTAHWQRVAGLQLDFDLPRARLNGVGLGDRLEKLLFLGRREDREDAASREYCYFSLGLEVDCLGDGETIDGFELVQKDLYSPKWQPFCGACHYCGREIVLARLNEQSLVEQFGPPYWRDEDEDEILLFYEFSPNIEWQVELSLDGTMNRIIITNDPGMADEGQRKAFRVTRSWPPAL
jgi:hypothetical protein